MLKTLKKIRKVLIQYNSAQKLTYTLKLKF